MHLRTSTTAIAIATMLAGSFAPLAPLQAQQNSRRSAAYCRTPVSLPTLAREDDGQRNQQNRPEPRRRVGTVSDREMASAVPPPPPPPPSPAPLISDDVGDIAVTASASRGEASDASGPDESSAASSAESTTYGGRIIMPSPVPPRPYPHPQAGRLTAGEHDDLLNPELYARYVRDSNLAQSIPSLPRVDTARLLTVEVHDANGRGVPFAEVVLTCSDGNAITLATQADGRVTFFPGIDRLSRTATVRVRYQGRWQGAARPIAIAAEPGVQSVGFTVGNSAVAATKLDLMLVVDTTGSMGDEIGYLQSELQSIVSSIRHRHPGLDVRVGFVFYRDIGDDYVTRTVPFDRDMGRASTALGEQYATGGGDYPEAMDQALIRAVGQGWRPDAVKTMLLVADAPPHDDLFGQTWGAVESLRAQRVQIVPVAASGVADNAEYAMRAMAAFTQSRYLFLTDDSGIGNAHAAPAIDCYLVTRLDALLRRVIDSQISGRRIEPSDGEIIRSVGQYDGGRCVLPPNFGKDS